MPQDRNPRSVKWHICERCQIRLRYPRDPSRLRSGWFSQCRSTTRLPELDLRSKVLRRLRPPPWRRNPRRRGTPPHAVRNGLALHHRRGAPDHVGLPGSARAEKDSHASPGMAQHHGACDRAGARRAFGRGLGELPFLDSHPDQAIARKEMSGIANEGAEGSRRAKT